MDVLAVSTLGTSNDGDFERRRRFGARLVGLRNLKSFAIAADFEYSFNTVSCDTKKFVVYRQTLFVIVVVVMTGEGRETDRKQKRTELLL